MITSTTQHKLEEFEERFKTAKIHGFRFNFYDRICQFPFTEQNINLGTIGNYIGTLKAIARDAKN
jgi:hypothetical protein